MFEGGKFKEGEDSVTLQPVEDEDPVVTAGSVEMLIQWLYLAKVAFPELKHEDEITLALEFVRLADMVEVSGIESLVTEHIKSIMVKRHNKLNTFTNTYEDPGTNMTYVTLQHIKSARKLPDGHAVKELFTVAAVEGYLLYKTFKLQDHVLELPGYSTDLLLEVKKVLVNLEIDDLIGVRFVEPLSGERRDLWIASNY